MIKMKEGIKTAGVAKAVVLFYVSVYYSEKWVKKKQWLENITYINLQIIYTL